MKIHKKYKPLWTKKYRYAVVSGGRGSGKSFGVQTFIRDLTYESGHKMLLTRYTMKSAEKSIIPEFKSKLDLDPSPYNKNATMEVDFKINNDEVLNLHSQSEIIFTGLKTSSGNQTARLKSVHDPTTWVIEEAEELVDDGSDTEASTFDKTDDSIRKKDAQLRTILVWNPSNEESFVYKRFFKGKGENGSDIPIDFNGIIDDVLYIYTTYEDNRENLNEATLRKIDKMAVENPARHNHIYLGFPLKDVNGALWRQATMIDPYRVYNAPELRRVVIGLDPSVENTGDQDECGIIGAGLGFDGHYYVLSDVSGVLTTGEWKKISVGEYKNQKADRIVPEVNNGGQLVVDAIHTVDKAIPVKPVRASRGKITRAEPVSALYEEGLVHHVGRFPELELQMTTFDGTGESPGRYDALVWAITELSQNELVELRIRSL